MEPTHFASEYFLTDNNLSLQSATEFSYQRRTPSRNAILPSFSYPVAFFRSSKRCTLGGLEKVFRPITDKATHHRPSV
jgi:hypothetical protein